MGRKLSIHFAKYTEQGSREINQDAVYANAADDIAVFCVADGMGGHSRGEEASGQLIKEIEGWTKDFSASVYHGSIVEIADSFEKMLNDAGRKIMEQHPGEICGSTLSGLLINEGSYVVFNVGDSRVYRRRKGSFEQITRDDVWQNRRDIISALSEEEIRDNINYGRLTKAFGIDEKVTPFRITDALIKGDAFLLVTDGAYKYIAEEELQNACMFSKFSFSSNRQPRVNKNAERLKSVIQETSMPDNYSFVLVHVS